MTDPTIEPAEGRPTPEQLVEVHLPGAEEEDSRTTHEKDRTRDPNRLEEKPWRQDHVRQEERRQPARGRPMGEPKKDWIEDHIEECCKGADHDQHLKSDDEIQDDDGPEKTTWFCHT